MEEDQNQASTSKIHQYYRRKSQNDEDDDDGGNDDPSEGQSASSLSERSRQDADTRRHDNQPIVVELATEQKQQHTNNSKAPDKRRSTGRIEKRSRRKPRRVPKRRPRKEEKRFAKSRRNPSTSSIFSRVSSRAGGKATVCRICGHTCCRRRRNEAKKRRYRRRNTKTNKVNRIKKRKPKKILRFNKRPEIIKGKVATMSKGLQMGSPCVVLSPLCLKTNMVLADQANVPEPTDCSEVTPEMIYEALKTLTMWTFAVEIQQLMDYIMRKYPVNPDKEALEQELRKKLEIAAIVGMVVESYPDSWLLSGALDKTSGLTENHVSLFWQLYLDTLKPIPKTDPEDATQERNVRVQKKLRIIPSNNEFDV